MSYRKHNSGTRNVVLAIIAVLTIFVAFIFGEVVLLVESNNANNNAKYREQVRKGLFLPEGSTDIINIGRGWQEFTYKNQRFLYHQYQGGGFECIVKISEEK